MKQGPDTSAPAIVAGTRRAGDTRQCSWPLVAKAAHMRTSPLFALGLAVSLVTVPHRIAAQRGQNQSSVYATFERSGSNTELLGLAVGDLTPGYKITLSCSGPSCAFETKTINISSNVKVLALTDMFVDTNLKPGTVVEVRVLRPGSTGKVYLYETRISDNPKMTLQCLPPGAAAPVAC